MTGLKSRTRTGRLPPCPPYDVEGTERWLGDMAAQGWRLQKDGLFFGVALFEKRPPAAVRYRLEAALRQAGSWDDTGGRPDEEALALNADHGWTYLARRGQFYIYCNETPGARELNTDPQVQALAIKAVQKRQLHNLLLTAFWWVIYPLAYLFGQGFSLLLTAARVGPVPVVLSVVIPWWMVADGILEIVHLQRLKKRLQAGIPLAHDRPPKRRRGVYFAKRVLKAAAMLLWLTLFLRLWSIDTTDADKQPLADYAGTPPFATIADLAAGDYAPTWQALRYNYVAQWSNALVQGGMEWVEHASVRRADGTALQGGLYITCYNAKSEWLARALAAACLRTQRARAGKSYAALPCPALGLDDAVAYYNELRFPCLILRQGATVLQACFYQVGPDEEMPWEEWAGILADSIR